MWNIAGLGYNLHPKLKNKRKKVFQKSFLYQITSINIQMTKYKNNYDQNTNKSHDKSGIHTKKYQQIYSDLQKQLSINNFSKKLHHQSEQQAHKIKNKLSQQDFQNALKTITSYIQEQLLSFNDPNLPQLSHLQTSLESLQIDPLLTTTDLRSKIDTIQRVGNSQLQNEEDSFQALQVDTNEQETTPYPKKNLQIPLQPQTDLSRIDQILNKLILLNSITFSKKISPLLQLKLLQKPITQKSTVRNESQNGLQKSPLLKEQLQKNYYKNKDQILFIAEKQQKKNQSKPLAPSLKTTPTPQQLAQGNSKSSSSSQQQKIEQNELQFENLTEQTSRQNLEQQKNSKPIQNEQQNNDMFEQLHQSQRSFKGYIKLFEHEKEIKTIQEKDQKYRQLMNELLGHYVKYFIHFSQFILEILTQLSTCCNILLNSTYNVVRYIIANLTIHFKNQIFSKIRAQIKQSLKSEQHWKSFLDKLNHDQRIKTCEKKIATVQQMTYNKIISYLQKLKKSNLNKQVVKSPTNITKIKEFKLQKPQLISMVKDLNTDFLIDKEYSFDKVIKIYTQMVSLARQEILHEKFLETSFKRLAKQHKIKRLDLGTFLNQMNEGLSRDQNAKNLFDKTLILIMQQVKVSNFLLCLPYYTFANELQNVDRKLLNEKQTGIRLVQNNIKNKLNHNRSREKMSPTKQNIQKEQLQLILRNMDVFYIMRGKRLNRQYWQERLKMDEFEFYEDIDNYLAIHQRLMQFHVRNSLQIKKKNNYIQYCLMLREYEKQSIETIHSEQWSIFNKKEEQKIRKFVKNTVLNNEQYKYPFSPKPQIITQLNKAMESFFSDF